MAYASSSDALALMPGGQLSSTTDTSYAAALTLFLTYASDLVDERMGRERGFFAADTDDATRWYDGPDGTTDDPAFLRIDECVSVTGVSIAETGDPSALTATATDDWFLWPHNYGAKSVPIRALILDRMNGDYANWPPYPKSVRVTGKFGYAATPPVTVKLAVCMQAVRWYKRLQAAMQSAAAIPELGTMVYAALDPDIEALLRPYILELSE